jgi:hypothetical protein
MVSHGEERTKLGRTPNECLHGADWLRASARRCSCTCQPLFWGSGVKTTDGTFMSHASEDQLLFRHAFSVRGNRDADRRIAGKTVPKDYGTGHSQTGRPGIHPGAGSGRAQGITAIAQGTSHDRLVTSEGVVSGHQVDYSGPRTSTTKPSPVGRRSSGTWLHRREHWRREASYSLPPRLQLAISSRRWFLTEIDSTSTSSPTTVPGKKSQHLHRRHSRSPSAVRPRRRHRQ